MTALVAALYSIFELGQQSHFLTSAFDLGIFDQAVHGYAHLGAPVSLIKGVHDGFGTHFSVLGDHFSPILAVLAPVYRVFPHAQTLLVAQGVLFAASVPSVWLFTRRSLGRGAAYPIAIAYALAWGFQSAMADDFHEIAFAVPLIAFALERLDAGKLRPAIISALLLLLVKEDLGLIVAAFGVVVGVRTTRWRLGGVLVLAGIVAAVLSTEVFIPAAGGRAGYYWNYYIALGSGPLAALWHVVRHPLSTLHLATHPAQKVRLLQWLFLPLGLASLGSSFVLLAIPQLAELLLSDNPYHWQLDSHYIAILVPILTLAAVDGVAKLRRRTERLVPAGRPIWARVAGSALGLAYAGGVLAVAIWALAQMPFHEMTQHWWWHTNAYQSAERAAVDVVPSGATVEASDHLAPQLTDRARVMLLDATPREAPWVVFDADAADWPLTSAEQLARPGWLLSHDYRQVFSRSGIVVYHRTTGAGAQ